MKDRHINTTIFVYLVIFNENVIIEHMQRGNRTNTQELFKHSGCKNEPQMNRYKKKLFCEWLRMGGPSFLNSELGWMDMYAHTYTHTHTRAYILMIFHSHEGINVTHVQLDSQTLRG